MTESLDRLQRELSRLGTEHDPPAGWEARVLAEIDNPTSASDLDAETSSDSESPAGTSAGPDAPADTRAAGDASADAPAPAGPKVNDANAANAANDANDANDAKPVTPPPSKPGIGSTSVESPRLPARRRPRQPLSSVWLGAPVLAAAAMVLLIWHLKPPRGGSPGSDPETIALAEPRSDRHSSLHRPKSKRTQRSRQASRQAVALGQVGDMLQAKLSGAEYVGIWVYRNANELIVSCPGSSSCLSVLGTTTAYAMMREPGRYRVVLLRSSSPLPAPSGSLDADLATLARAGVSFHSEFHDIW